jgi:hypothetical protein
LQYYIQSVKLGLLSLFYLTMQFKKNLEWQTDQRLIGQKQLLEEHTKAIAQIEKTIAELKELKKVLQEVQ